MQATPLLEEHPQIDREAFAQAGRLDDHPLADLFPLMQGREFEDLVADVKAHGLLHPITTLGGKILDGRNRYRACLEAGITVVSAAYTGSDPRGFVIASNLHRRHLNESQRAMVAIKLANLTEGRPSNETAQISAVSQRDAAKHLNVSRGTVQHAVVVRDKAIPALLAAVEQGEIAVSVAAKLAGLPADRQRQALAEPDKARHLVKKYARTDREQELARRTITTSEALGHRVYGVIYADPPWRFEPYSTVTGMDRAADNHYSTMGRDELKAMASKVQTAAASDAVIFMWATVPMLPEALDLLLAWGFQYKSSIFWIKPTVGTGYWLRNQAEILLIGTRGDVPAPAPGEQPPQVVTAPRGKHSEKPAAFAESIERLFPSVPKLELFARRARPGWDAWGNEVDAASASANSQPP